MENPATWNRATKVISDALSGSLMQQHSGIFGYSPARIIHDALEKEGLLKSAPGEGSELPAMNYTPTDEDYKAVATSDPRTRAAMAACFLAADRQLKAALSSPQQESAEFTEAKKLLIEAREMRNLFVRADQNHGSKSADTMSEKADEIFYRILEFNKRVAPPVTAEGKRDGVK